MTSLLRPVCNRGGPYYVLLIAVLSVTPLAAVEPTFLSDTNSTPSEGASPQSASPAGSPIFSAPVVALDPNTSYLSLSSDLLEPATTSSTNSAPEDVSLDEKIEEFLKEHPDLIAGGLSGTYDKGLVLKPSEGPYDLKLNFRAQIWFDAIENDPSFPPLNEEADFPSDGDSFILRRLDMKFSGHVSEHVSWVLLIDPARPIGGRSLPLVLGSPTEAFLQNKRMLQDAYIDYEFLLEEHDWWLLDSMSLRVGQFKVPQTDDGLRSAAILEFPERSIIGYLFGVQRSAGAMLFGTMWDKRIVYQTGVFNGNGRNVFRDESDEKDVVARLEYQPFAAMLEEHAQWIKQVKADDPQANPEPLRLRKLAFGVAGGAGENGRADRTFHQDSFGVEFELEYDKYFFYSEWFRGKPIGSNLRTFATNAAPQIQGWYITIGVDPAPHWQTAVRYQRFDPNEDAPNDMVDVTSLGVSYFIDPTSARGKHGAKIQAAYNFNNIRSTPVATPTGFLADGDQFTLAFLFDY